MKSLIPSLLEAGFQNKNYSCTGEEFCLKNELIHSESGHRDLYDESIPATYLEYYLALRWFHLVSEGDLK